MMHKVKVLTQLTTPSEAAFEGLHPNYAKTISAKTAIYIYATRAYENNTMAKRIKTATRASNGAAFFNDLMIV